MALLSSTFFNPLVIAVSSNPRPKVTRAGKCFAVKRAVQIAEQMPQTKPMIFTESNGAPPIAKDAAEDFYNRMSTELVSYHADWDTLHATSTPIYQTAAFKVSSPTESTGFSYSRISNPTREALEVLLAKLDNAKYGYCFNTGMAALTAVFELVNPGDEIVTVEDIYGGSYNFIRNLMARKEGIIVKRVDTTNLKHVIDNMSKKTKLIWLETPTNPQLKISDIRAIAEIARAFGAILFIDNSIMSPVLNQPLDLGADIVMHSATKFIGGNNSVIAGSLATNRKDLADFIEDYKNSTGCCLGPMDSWLCLEGIKTMALRVQEKQKNAIKVAEFLAKHPKVKIVNYPGLPSNPGYELHQKQARGPGTVISFKTGSFALSKQVCRDTKRFSLTLGFGSVESALCLPWYTSHSEMPASVKERVGITRDLVRLSVGIEDADQLIEDLDQALAKDPTPVLYDELIEDLEDQALAKDPIAALN
ncbi:hypothetical protein QN277_026131 [Acacia crassicarpa]|uniref:Cystathionine beta-lyase n=1 Tax=Acacia crassicarpa TaxID=499986 RepID=A0AAE1J762_9FABA|nr:hypothetical protein QN277_026131 [Acacia crassicarpa]